MAGLFSCCSTRWRPSSFRVAYAELCEALADPYFAHLTSAYAAAYERRRGGGGGGDTSSTQLPVPLADVLCETWPYADDRRLDADGGLLHEELVRIEASWADKVLVGRLRSAVTKLDPAALNDVWAAAAQQKFPFPSAVMLVNAIADSQLDDHCWQLIHRLNALADVRMARSCAANAAKLTERASQFETAAETALRVQKDAVEGAGHGRTQRRMRAKPEKLQRGGSEWNMGAALARGLTKTTRRRREKKRRASLNETDLIPNTPTSGADLGGGGNGSASSRARPDSSFKDAPPSARRPPKQKKQLSMSHQRFGYSYPVGLPSARPLPPKDATPGGAGIGTPSNAAWADKWTQAQHEPNPQREASQSKGARAGGIATAPKVVEPVLEA